MNRPTVSVVLPVHNGEPHLGQAVESILGQTLTDFELIVVDDGSTDRTPEITLSFGDPRVRLVRGDRNRGIVAALNRGLALAGGEYVARMDADDVSVPERFLRQVETFQADPDLAVLGTAYWAVDEEGRRIALHHQPATDTGNRWQVLFKSCFAHSSTMIRSRLLREHGLRYREEAPFAEDYDLWSRLLQYGTAANLQKPLHMHRVHPGQISRRKAETQERAACGICQRNLAALEVHVSLDQARVLRQLFHRPRSIRDEAGTATFRLFAGALSGLERRDGVDREVIRAIRRSLLGRVLRASLVGRQPFLQSAVLAWQLASGKGL